uniref:Uncharacterized protein n=1 Tax=Nothobranchius furzeri TaxID=105023 RepID=A0A1A8V3T5_NOTFU
MDPPPKSRRMKIWSAAEIVLREHRKPRLVRYSFHPLSSSLCGHVPSANRLFPFSPAFSIHYSHNNSGPLTTSIHLYAGPPLSLLLPMSSLSLSWTCPLQSVLSDFMSTTSSMSCPSDGSMFIRRASCPSAPPRELSSRKSCDSSGLGVIAHVKVHKAAISDRWGQRKPAARSEITVQRYEDEALRVKTQ